jgi:hypothetical protein
LLLFYPNLHIAESRKIRVKMYRWKVYAIL